MTTIYPDSSQRIPVAGQFDSTVMHFAEMSGHCYTVKLRKRVEPALALRPNQDFVERSRPLALQADGRLRPDCVARVRRARQCG